MGNTDIHWSSLRGLLANSEAGHRIPDLGYRAILSLYQSFSVLTFLVISLTACVRHHSEAFTLLRIVILIIASKGYPVNPGDSENPEGPLCEILAFKGEKEKKWTQLLGYCVWCCFSIPRGECDWFWWGANCYSGSLAHHLVSMVGVHEVEGGGGWAAQGRHQFSLSFGTRGFCSAWIRDGEGGWRSQGLGGRSRGQATQSICHWVCVELDLCVVEVLFAITIIGVPNTPNAKDSKTIRLNHLAHAVPYVWKVFPFSCLSGKLLLTLQHSTVHFQERPPWPLRAICVTNQPITYSTIHWESTMCRHLLGPLNSIVTKLWMDSVLMKIKSTGRGR